MIKQGDVISYLEMCKEEGVNLQRGMNFRLKGGFSVILMSLRPGAPYADRIEDEGRILIYEGHDISTRKGSPNPKKVDQVAYNPGGSFTQNGLFSEAALKYKRGGSEPELVKVYEKLRPGIWVYNGLFRLVDSWQEISNARKVFKFKLELIDDDSFIVDEAREIDHNRIIPTSVKLEVWRRDKGKCVKCSSQDNLHFDHIIPYSKGGSSLVAENIQILCARHNLEKRDKIE
jgi:hypothetical protein